MLCCAKDILQNKTEQGLQGWKWIVYKFDFLADAPEIKIAILMER